MVWPCTSRVLTQSARYLDKRGMHWHWVHSWTPPGVYAGWIAAPGGAARSQGRDGVKAQLPRLGRPGPCQKLSL